MVDARAVIKQLMTHDPDIAALLPGGVYTTADTPEIVKTMAAPNPFDAVGRVRPCAFVRNEVAATTGPRGRFVRQFLTIFFYDAAGYASITPAMNRASELLHEHRIGGGAYWLIHVDNVDDQYDDAILAFMHRSRYEVTVTRRRN